jgi:hypothetical protein
VAFGLVLAGLSADGQDSAQTLEPEVVYNSARGSVVIEYFVNVGEIADEIEDMEARLRVYGDGMTIVHYPAYMKQSGDYQINLSPAELQALMSSLAEKGVFDFDQDAAAAALREAKAARSREARAGRATLRTVTDDSVTVLRVRAESYRAAGAADVSRNVTKDIVWYGLESDAREYPNVADLADVAAAVREIGALAERTDREAVN